MTPVKPESIDDRSVPRKKYEAPRLEIYGNIHQLTHTIGNHGKVDGGVRNKSKTG
jgi:hypothetical protein